MRSLTWVYCAAILGGSLGSVTSAAGQENWRFPPKSREASEVSLVAHLQPAPPLPPTPDEVVPLPPVPGPEIPQPPGPKAPWLVDDASVGHSVTQDEALQSPNCGCEDIQYVCCPPCWLVRAEALFWDRTNAGNQVLAATDAGVTLSAGDLNFDYQAGPRLTLQRQNVIGAWGVELAYFGIDGFSATGVLANASTIPTIPPVNFGGLTTTNTYGSRIYSSEINLRRSLTERLTFVNGFRWVELGENLNTNIGGLATHNVNTNNHLYGYQIGGDYRFWTPNQRWFADGVVKAGIYHNSSDQITTTAGIGGALPAAFAANSHLAFVGEAGIYGGYRLTDSWRLISGYSLMMLSGVAEAPRQFSTTNIVTGVATVNNNGTPFYHGATIGLEWVH